MTLQIVTVTDSIAALTVAGLHIQALDIPPDATRQTPILFPEPVNFLTDFTMVRDSFGGGSSALMTVTYQLHYTFCFVPIGSGRTGLDLYSDMTAMVAAIFDAIMAIDTLTGAIDIQPLAATEFGPVPDPAGNQYLGCRLAFQISEYVN
jgi:hypothetical protein